MRTKTLLLGVAAALATGLTAVQAQTVYSQNTVGYINVTIPGHGWYILASDMQNGSDANATNNDLQAVFGPGMGSDPAGPTTGTNTQCLLWQGNGFITYYYLNAADAVSYNGAGSTAGWVDSGGNPIPPGTVFVNQGLAAFIYNASPAAITPTLLGSVVQGTNIYAIPFGHKGFNFMSIADPLGTNVDAPNVGLNGALTSDPNGPTTGTNDQLLLWQGNGYVTYYYLNAVDAVSYNGPGSTAGFVDSGGNPIGTAGNVSAGQGFLLLHFGPPGSTWTNIFTVQ